MIRTTLLAAAMLLSAAPSGFCWSQRQSGSKDPSATSLTASPSLSSSLTSSPRATSSAATSSTAMGGAGGRGGTGGTSSSSVTIDNTVGSSSSAAGRTSGGGGGGFGFGGGGSRSIANVPDVVMPSFEGGTNPCVNSIAAGGAGIGFGFGLGGSFNNSACERRALSAMLYMEGQRGAAIALLCQSENVARAMAAAGTPCPAPSVASPVVPVAAPVAPEQPGVSCHEQFHYPMKNGHRDPNGAGYMQTVCTR